MFTVEIKINGALIGHLYGRNVKSLALDVCEYNYEYYEVETARVIRGKTRHARGDGIARLVSDILNRVSNKQTKL